MKLIESAKSSKKFVFDKIRCEYCGHVIYRNKTLNIDVSTMKCPSCNKSSIDVVEEEIDDDINFA